MKALFFFYLRNSYFIERTPAMLLTAPAPNSPKIGRTISVSCWSNSKIGFSNGFKVADFVFILIDGGSGYYFTTRAVFVCAAACQWMAIFENSWHSQDHPRKIEKQKKRARKIQNAGHTSFIDCKSINSNEMRAKKRGADKNKQDFRLQ